MLIYQNALQLYLVDDGSYLTSIDLSQIKALQYSGNNVLIEFRNQHLGQLEADLNHPLLKELDATSNKKIHFSAREKFFAVIALLVIAIIGLYFLFTALVPYVGLKLISRDQEQVLGNKIFETILEKDKIDKHKSEQIQAFANELSLSKHYPIKVFVVKDDIINAFAIPGGYIVINTGLLEKLPTASSLAALLGHEVAHINQRHTLQSLLKEGASMMFLSVVVGDATAILGTLASNANALRNLSFSRSLEQEADEKSVEMLLQNQINVEGMLELLHTLEEEEETQIPALLSTHPLTKERIKFVEKLIEEKAVQQNAVLPTNLNRYWKVLKE